MYLFNDIIVSGDIMLSLMIFINKLVTKVCKLFGKNGSVLPGCIVYDYLHQKKILEKVKYPKYVIAVTGSSGKGSTKLAYMISSTI